MRKLNKHPFDIIAQEAIRYDAISIIGNIGTGKTFMVEKIKLNFTMKFYHIVTLDIREEHNSTLGYEYIGIKTLSNIMYGRNYQDHSNPLVVVVDSVDMYKTQGMDRDNILQTLYENYQKLNIIPVFVHDIHRNNKRVGTIPLFDTVINMQWDDNQRIATIQLKRFDSDGEIYVRTTKNMYG